MIVVVLRGSAECEFAVWGGVDWPVGGVLESLLEVGGDVLWGGFGCGVVDWFEEGDGGSAGPPDAAPGGWGVWCALDDRWYDDGVCFADEAADAGHEWDELLWRSFDSAFWEDADDAWVWGGFAGAVCASCAEVPDGFDC